MTHSSIGSGAAADSNENHSTDGLPSKTMGAETGRIKAGFNQAAQLPEEQKEATDAAIAESELSSVSELLNSGRAKDVPENPGNYPDGPNVAPSPWEADAARGKP